MKAMMLCSPPSPIIQNIFPELTSDVKKKEGRSKKKEEKDPYVNIGTWPTLICCCHIEGVKNLFQRIRRKKNNNPFHFLDLFDIRLVLLREPAESRGKNSKLTDDGALFIFFFV